MKFRNLTAISASAVFLVACGGGGGSTTVPVTPTNPTAPPVVVDQNALQNSAGTSTYSGVFLSAYNTLNSARLAYGVGALNQNGKLDTAALNHAKYVTLRWAAKDFTNTGHVEDASKPGFTGVNPSDRISFAGYAAVGTGEAMTTFIAVDGVQSDPGVTAINNLLSGPYHRFALFDGYRDLGVGDSSDRFAGEGGVNHTVVLNMAVAQGMQNQLPSQSWVGVWPLDNAVDVRYGFAGETPNPIPANNGACAGYPVSVQVRGGQTLSTTSFTMTDAGGAAVSVQLSTAATDANPAQARANSAYIIPFKPLKLNTKYTAHFVGNANGVAIDKTWSFTTTSQNQKMIFGCDPS
jgi:uncharacterized protein YkwD